MHKWFAGDSPMDLQCKHVINAAGLSAPDLARTIITGGSDFDIDGNDGRNRSNDICGSVGGGDSSVEGALAGFNIPTAYFAKGNYYALLGPAPFSMLVTCLAVPMLPSFSSHRLG
jgi:hypothetical protein